MAIVCKEAAKVFLDNVEGFEVVAECTQNTDIFVIKSDNPKKVGVTQDRNYQIDLAKSKFGEDIEIVPMMAQALPYALENNELDAVVIDVMKGIHLDGKKESTAINGDYTSYVLISSKKYMKTRGFKKFVKEYNKALEQLLKDDDLLEKHFFNYTNTNLMEGGLDRWKIKFMPIQLK